jgi:Holliday junction resolvase
MNGIKQNHDRLVKRIASRYENQGYEIVLEPNKDVIPFDLGSYRPDLLAKKNGESLIIEIKASRSRVAVEHFKSIAELVAREKGWRFLLVTGDDDSLDVDSDVTNRFVPISEVLQKIQDAERLADSLYPEAALLFLWANLESVLRIRAEAISLPIDRLPSASLYKHLYSQGELSVEQYSNITKFREYRNRVAHGFQAEIPTELIKDMIHFIHELISAWFQETNNNFNENGNELALS